MLLRAKPFPDWLCGLSTQTRDDREHGISGAR